MQPLKKIVPLVVGFVCLLLASGREGRAQDTNAAAAGASQADPAAMMAMMAEMAKPGENHKILAEMAGRWNYAAKYWMNPDTNAPPLLASGTTVTKPLMSGRYFISEHKGLMAVPAGGGASTNLEFNGMELAGYDNAKQKFVSTWIDNFGTGIMSFEGTYDGAARAITYTGEDAQMAGAKVREVVTLVDHDHRKMEYFAGQGGHEMKFMEIIYTRSEH